MPEAVFIEGVPSIAFEPVTNVSASDWDMGSDGSIEQTHENISNTAIDAEVEAIRKSGLFDENFYLSMYTGSATAASRYNQALLRARLA